jgi:N-acyl homoserine lactone hydrolase
MAGTATKLRGIAEQPNANVIFGHDAEQLWSLRRSPDGPYTRADGRRP